MKRIISILLVCILVINLAGFYIYFVVRLVELRMEMRQELALLPSDQLEKVIVPLDKFKPSWLAELEMKWNGKMYDIARIEADANGFVVYALHDATEDDLLVFINRVIDVSSNDKNKAPSAIIQFLMLKFVPVASARYMSQNFVVIVHYSAYLLFQMDTELLPESPPPRA